MNLNVLQNLRALIDRESGIHLPQEKEQLLLNRIQKRLKTLGLRTAEEYLNVIEVDASGEELRRLLDVVSTNVTHFYRESAHFEVLADLYKRWAREGKSEVKLWSAACSSGEEPYTMAMVAAEVVKESSFNIRILATDISERILQEAITREYREVQLEKLPTSYAEKYFQPIEGEEGQRFRVTDEIAKKVIFKRLNLSKFPYPLKGSLECIFCRNVMIYFTKELRQQIIDEFYRKLKPGGYLFISHSENLLGITHKFGNAATAVYQKGTSSEK